MSHKQSSLFVFTATAVLAVGACQSDPQQDEQERLQALLRDVPLKHVPPGADVASAPQGDGAAKATGDHSNIILPTVHPLGIWNFDDCTPSRTNLSDASFNNNTAYRAVAVACTSGIQNSQAVEIAAPEDIVYVPDQPNFTFENGVTVAGWFRPEVSSGTATLFRKRDKGTSSFALLLDSGKFEFVVNIGNGIALGLLSPSDARLGEFQHVAGTYDGSTARLYVDGHEVNHFAIPGAIPLGPGPLLIGNDGSERRFAGAIDSALFTTHALTADEVLALTCFPQSPSLVVTPTSPMTPPGVPATIDLALTNHNPAACAPITFSLTDVFSFDNRLTLNPTTTVQSSPVPSGTTGHMTITATPKISVDPGTSLSFEFEVTEPVTSFFDFGFETVRVSDQAGCHVTPSRELMVINPEVVNDPVRTVFNPSSQDARNGVWSFKHLMENIAPTAAGAPAMVETMLNSYTTAQAINGFTVAARPGMQSQVLSSWPRTPDGALDLAHAPLRLLAIVNRFDLRNLDNGDAGELRFVFVFNSPFSSFFPLQATMSLEYKLPAMTQQDVLNWAQSFHALGAMQFSENYNNALQAITEQIVARNARPGFPNGSALSAVHTNELAFGNNGLWELREFHLSPSSGLLAPAPLTQTPDRSFNNTTTLASFITANQDAILADNHVVPEVFNGQPFQAGAVFNSFTWLAPGADSEARHHLALDTCNGCHSTAETGTSFQQIVPEFQGSEAQLSNFLTGVTVSDPVTQQSRTFNDLARRQTDLQAVVCTN